jgi:hypothetical protein
MGMRRDYQRETQRSMEGGKLVELVEGPDKYHSGKAKAFFGRTARSCWLTEQIAGEYEAYAQVDSLVDRYRLP